LKPFNLPLTLGPEVLMALSFVMYLFGFTEGWFAWDFTFHLALTVLLLIFQLYIRNTLAFITIAVVGFFNLGMLSRSTKGEIREEGICYFQLSKIQQYENHFQAYGKQYIRKKNRLIPTDQQVVCTIRKALIPFKTLQPGDLIAAHGEMNRILSDNNPGSFDVETYYRSKGILYRCFIQDTVKLLGKYPNWQDCVEIYRQQLASIFDRDLSTVESGLAKALLLGDGSSVDSSSKAAFSATGAIHVLAVSGMHVSLFAQILLMFMGIFHRIFQKRVIQVICILVLWNYALLTGLSPSVVRSVTMFTMLQMAQFVGKDSPHNHSVLLCAFVMVVFDPLCILDIGFQLSFLAVLGIFNFQKRIEHWITPQNKIIRFLWSNTCVALAAQSLTLPLTLYYFHTFPNYFLLANIGVAVISVASMYLGFLYLFLCTVPYLGAICAVPFEFSLKALNHFLNTIAHIPGAIAEGYMISIPVCILLLLAIAGLFYSKIHFFFRCIPITLLVIFITVQRYQRQRENHLYLFSGKNPMLVVKNGTSATVLVAKKHMNNTANLICTNYRRIYGLNRLDTVYLQERDSLTLPYLTVLKQQQGLTLTFKKSHFIDAHTFHLAITPKGWYARKIKLH
jgi:competence protein ComEC